MVALTQKQYEILDLIKLNGKVNVDSYPKKMIQSLVEKEFLKKSHQKGEVTKNGIEALDAYEAKHVIPTDLDNLTEEEYNILFSMTYAKKDPFFPKGSFQAGSFPWSLLKTLSYKGCVELNSPEAKERYPYETVTILQHGRDMVASHQEKHGIKPPSENDLILAAMKTVAFQLTSERGSILLKNDPQDSPLVNKETLLMSAGFPSFAEARKLAEVFPDELELQGDLLIVKEVKEEYDRIFAEHY